MRYVALAVLLLATRVHAHSVPIPPSLCTFDPLVIAASGSSFTATAAAPGATDTFRIVYDAAASAAQFCAADPADPQNRCATVTPERSFSGGGISGTLRMPAFSARLLASGDLAATVSLSVTVDAQSATIALPLTTGLVVAGTTVVAGSPIAGDGHLELVGTATIDTLATPLGGTPLVVRLTCTAAPAPDLDQFVPATETRRVGGKIGATGVKVGITFRAGREVTTPDFAAPAVVRVAAGDAAVATLALPSLEPQGKRKFVGSTADGSVTIRRVRGSTYRMSVRTAAATPPTASTSIEVTYQVGGLISRGMRTFRTGRGGLHAP
jgi:hypothetical protein